MLGKSFLAGGMKSIRNKHVYRCGVGQRVVFEEEFVIHLATQYLNILPMFWVLPLHMSLVADIAHLWLEKLKMLVICFSSPTLPLAFLQLEYMHVI